MGYTHPIGSEGLVSQGSVIRFAVLSEVRRTLIGMRPRTVCVPFGDFYWPKARLAVVEIVQAEIWMNNGEALQSNCAGLRDYLKATKRR